MKYPILEKFSPEAIADAAARVYDQPYAINRRVCADGLCVMARLLKHDYAAAYDEFIAVEEPDYPGTPDENSIATMLYGTHRDDLDYNTQELAEWEALRDQVSAITRLNDSGNLATPEGVAALFAEE